MEVRVRYFIEYLTFTCKVQAADSDDDDNDAEAVEIEWTTYSDKETHFTSGQQLGIQILIFTKIFLILCRKERISRFKEVQWPAGF